MSVSAERASLRCWPGETWTDPAGERWEISALVSGRHETTALLVSLDEANSVMHLPASQVAETMILSRARAAGIPVNEVGGGQ